MKKENDKLNIEDIRKQLKELQKQKDEYLAGWQRSRADLLNYKKEEMERIGEILKYGTVELILRFFPILDNFNLVEKKLPEDLKNNENVKGVLQIKTQIEDFLKSQGVEEIKALGERFDPNFHEVIGKSEPAFAPASALTGFGEAKPTSAEALADKEATASEAGIITEEVQKGYTINGKLLRPAKVKINK